MVEIVDSTDYIMRANVNKIIPIVESFGYTVRDIGTCYLTVCKNDKIIGTIGASIGSLVTIDGSTDDFLALANKLETIDFKVKINKK